MRADHHEQSHAENSKSRWKDCWLYAIASPADLARRLSTPDHPLETKEILELCADAGNFRLFFKINDKGKRRAIQEPKPRLQWIHRRIYKLLSKIKAPAYMHSSVRGRSYVSNANPHRACYPTIKIDVKQFYVSVLRRHVLDFFLYKLNCRRDVARILADLLTYEGHLPTGGGASSIIAYYCFVDMFDEIHRLSVSLNLRMSCYIDDISITGKGAGRGTLHLVRQIIARYGLQSHKAYSFSVGQPRIITGVCNTLGGPRVPNKLHLKISCDFSSLQSAKNYTVKEKILAALLGRLDAAGQVDSRFRRKALAIRKALGSKSSILDL